MSNEVAMHLQAAADRASAAMHAGTEALRPYLAIVLPAEVPHQPEIVMAAAGAVVIGGIAITALQSLRRRRKLKTSLVEASLGHDPKTGWLELTIVVRNLQSRSLLVRSIQVLDPPGTKVCERWQAWRPATAGVKFVAPELELTNVISIERTVLPYEPANYAMFGGDHPRGSARQNAQPSHDEDRGSPCEELTRHFYVLLPGAPRRTALRARLVCELQTRRGRRQELAFRRTLPFIATESRPRVS